MKKKRQIDAIYRGQKGWKISKNINLQKNMMEIQQKIGFVEKSRLSTAGNDKTITKICEFVKSMQFTGRKRMKKHKTKVLGEKKVL